MAAAGDPRVRTHAPLPADEEGEAGAQALLRLSESCVRAAEGRPTRCLVGRPTRSDLNPSDRSRRGAAEPPRPVARPAPQLGRIDARPVILRFLRCLVPPCEGFLGYLRPLRYLGELSPPGSSVTIRVCT